ncbi:MAG: hypothetical protein IBX49_03840 [Gammaproteobacteria bacterium]|nr:hypothetical protein [Gammaproteobacteria bacterium]
MSSYFQLFEGPLSGMMRWPQWEALLDKLNQDNDGGWFIYYVGEAVPENPLQPDAFRHFLNELDTMLRHDHQEEYFGIAYVDDMAKPTFVKIYDPNNLGSACGSSVQKVLPGWTISRAVPADLQATVHNPGGRRRWWQALFSKDRPHA